MNPVAERMIWIVNGLLVIVFSLADHWSTLILAASVTAFVFVVSSEQTSWAIGAAVLSIVAGTLAPSPVPIFLLVMSLAGWGSLFLEKYNRPAACWNVINWVSIYAVAGLGFTLYKISGIGSGLAGDPQMAQGSVYLNAIIGMTMYIMPIGYLAMVTKSIWAHAPTPGGRPAELISTIRTRGKS